MKTLCTSVVNVTVVLLILVGAHPAEAQERRDSRGIDPYLFELAEAILESNEVGSLISCETLETLEKAQSGSSRELSDSLDRALFEAAEEAFYFFGASDWDEDSISHMQDFLENSALVWLEPLQYAKEWIALRYCGETSNACLQDAESILNASTLVREELARAGGLSFEEYVRSQPSETDAVLRSAWIALAEYEFWEHTALGSALDLSFDGYVDAVELQINNGDISGEFINLEFMNASTSMGPSPCSQGTAGIEGGAFGNCGLPTINSAPNIDPSPIASHAGGSGFVETSQTTPVPHWYMPGECFGMDPTILFDGHTAHTAPVPSIPTVPGMAPGANGMGGGSSSNTAHMDHQKRVGFGSTREEARSKLSSTGPSKSGGSGGNDEASGESGSSDSTPGTHPVWDSGDLSLVCGGNLLSGLTNCMFSSDSTGSLLCDVHEYYGPADFAAPLYCLCKGGSGGSESSGSTGTTDCPPSCEFMIEGGCFDPESCGMDVPPQMYCGGCFEGEEGYANLQKLCSTGTPPSWTWWADACGSFDPSPIEAFQFITLDF